MNRIISIVISIIVISNIFGMTIIADQPQTTSEQGSLVDYIVI